MLRAQLGAFFVFFVCLLLVTLFCMLILLRRRLQGYVVAPLEKLAAAMKTMEVGRPVALDHLAGSDREIMVLVDSFQAMAFRLNSSYRELNEANQALRESEQRFKSVFDHAPYAIVVNRLEDGLLLDANEAFVARWGPTKEKALQHQVEALTVMAVEEAASIRQAVIEHGGVFGREVDVTQPDGSEGRVLFSSVPISFGNVPSVLTMTVDITERKRVEEELRASREKFWLFVVSSGFKQITNR